MSSPYPSVEPKPDLPAIEHRVLDRWKTDGTFERSIEQRPAEAEYVFYDGPPFANGLPHHGHLLTGFVKDVIPRYQTMRGHKVDRRFGWDCHGLPAEMEAEKQLGVSGRAAITEMGIEKFNDFCRTSVLRYTGEWEETVTRQARWVDFAHDYKTMDLSYMESVMWAFKQLWDKGLIYEANRVMPYSWGAETPLSNFEIRLDDATRPRQDPAATVSFRLAPLESDQFDDLQLLAWTTTPWTLPSNLGLAVGPDVEYAVYALDGRHVVLGAAAAAAYAKELEGADLVATMPGSELVGRKYEPLFPYFVDQCGPNGFTVLGADWIDTTEGTGIVHLAPGFGEEDQKLGEANDLGMAVPVDDSGRFTDDVPEWAGENVFEANPGILRHLRDTGELFRHDSYTHNYPHCWRTDTPIIYRALPSWYVRVTDISERLMELNQEINWVPENVRDGRFGKWLEGARDWSISRNRFWGSPIPVWKSDDPAYPRIDVYGSLDEIEADFGVRPDDLHRPFIDGLTRPNPDDPTGRATMRRIPEVLDCWFESGSMPFAQVHYPFENKEWFESHFPADFIVEYINQTRGWFYTLHVLAGALFDKPAFENVICHGILLAEDGAKLSKKLRNYTEPNEVFEKQGADALRWYFMSSNIVRGGDARLSDHAIDDVVRQVITPVWNAYSFFTLYANIDGYRAEERTDSQAVLDRYILAKTRQLVVGTEACLDAYDLPGACAEIHSFIDALNNWYIRRSRDRFWSPANPAADGDKRDAYDTLYTVLTTLCRVAAPLLPLVTEEMYTGLTDADSVHLTSWPDAANLPGDAPLVAAMDRLRDVASTGLRLREDEGLRVRLPLSSVTVVYPDAEELTPYVDLLKDELNVKRVFLEPMVQNFAVARLQPDGKMLGPKLGKDVQSVFKAAQSGDWTPNSDGTVDIAGHTLEPDEFSLTWLTNDEATAAALPSNEGVIELDTTVTEPLRREGAARDLVRQIQQARKDKGFVVTDRIVVQISAPDELVESFRLHEDLVTAQVLATAISYSDGPTESTTAVQATIDGESVRFELRLSDA
jgi:isoleucyl-tRNA synthetase